MVTKGQFLERPTLIPVSGVVCEGLSHRGQKTPALLIVPPTPAEGGSMDHVVAAEVAWAAATRGFPTLRFNFRGVGGSQGERAQGSELVMDAEQALQLVIENTGNDAVVCLAIGSSAHVAVSLAQTHRSVVGLCLVSPIDAPTEALSRLHVPVQVVMGALDVRQARVTLAAAVSEAGGSVEIIDDADHVFTRQLPEVGRKVANFLTSFGG